MSQDQLYEEAADTFGPALDRLARSYEADADVRRDLLQDIHLAIWRSFATFDRKCSLRTWVYRVAHNVAASHVAKRRRTRAQTLLSLDEAGELSAADETSSSADRRLTLDKLYHLIQEFQLVDREVILLYLEGLDGASIAEITGISARNVATRIHRLKKILSSRFTKGGRHES